MKHRMIRRLGVGLVVLMAATARAQVTYDIIAMSVTNYTGFVIAADGPTNNPSYNRESLLTDSDVRVGNTGTGTATISYYLSYRLLDESSRPHPIYNAATGTGTNSGYSYRITNTVILQAGFAFVDNDLASLRPITRLSPSTSYTVELRLFTLGNVATGDVATDGPRNYYHWTNLVTDDPAFNVIASVEGAAFTRTYAVNTDPTRNSFQVDVDYTLRRYDNFMGLHTPADSIPVWMTVELRNAANNALVPLASPVTNFAVSLFKYDAPPPSDPIAPRVFSTTRTLNVIPADGVQLDSVNNQYRVSVFIAHTENTNAPPLVVPGNSVSTPAQQLLHFNGTLLFGAINTRFTSIDNDPPILSTVASSHVNTRLGVDQMSGFLVGDPAWTYGDGTDLLVRLLSNGTAEFSLGSIPLDPPNTEFKLANVRVQYEQIILRPSGLWANLQVFLPTGFGYRADTNGHFLNGRLAWADVALGNNLQPAADLSYAPGANFFCAEETKPVWLECSALLWRVALGRFDLTPGGPAHYVRQDEYASLTAVAAALDNSELDLKRSNERSFATVSAIAAPLTVTAAADCTARLSANLSLGPGAFRAHFPYDTAVQWTGNGSLRIVDDNVVSSASQLASVGVVGVPYDTGCPGCEAGAQVKTAALVPAGNVLTFTRDGGLIGGGTMVPAHRLQWGWISSLNDFAHEAFLFDRGNLHIPGIFLRGDQVELPLPLRANALVFTGVAATNAGYLERPDLPGTANQARYELGFADYAGINFAVGTDAAKQAESVLGGTATGTYDLKANSKYYARRGGVNGVHDATPGSFPDELVLYGYQFQFTNFGFNLIDNQMRRSLIRGSIELPYPSGFDQHFDQLRLNCLGAIERAEIGAGDVTNHLVYWNNTFQTRGLEFRKHPDNACNATGGFLVLGIETQIAYVPETLVGFLGFLPNGDLISRSVGVAGIDSRLKLPTLVQVAGPAAEVYALNPVADAYFNRWADHPVTELELGQQGQGYGWVNVAGSIDVPFFEDINVHVQFSASLVITNPPVHVMGGWPTENNGANHGWGTPQANYFAAPYFDDVNRGFADGGTVAHYRDSGSDQYHPRAQRSWLKVVNFDYPLQWFPTLRKFRSRMPVENDLLLLHTEHQAKNLSAQNAELTFGTQFEFLPSANLANLFFNALDEATGVAASLANVLGATAHQDITNGFRRLDQLLAPQLIEFYDPVFDAVLEPRIGTLYAELAGEFANAPNPPAFLATALQSVTDALQDGQPGNVHDLLIGLAGNNPGEPGLMGQTGDALTSAERGVGELSRLFAPDPDGLYNNGANLILQLVDDFAPPLHEFLLANVVQQYLGSIGGNFDALAADMTGTQGYFNGLGENLATPNGLGTEIKARLNSVAAQAEVNTLVTAASTAISDYLENINYNVDSPFEDYTQAEIARFIRREIEDRYHGTTMTPAVQSILRQRLYDQDAFLRLAADTAFQEVNEVIRDLLKESAQAISDEFTGWLPEHLRGIAASAGVDGYAKINGDSLKELRLNMKAKLELMRTMEFGAFVQIKELDSGGTPGCNYEGRDATEVSFGANASGLRWFGSETKVSVNNKLTFGDTGLLGMAGSFDLGGDLGTVDKIPSIGIGPFQIQRLAAAMALGLEENYISGGGKILLSKKVIAGGVFAGRACVLDPIKLWDPTVASVLGASEFTGVYGYGELWISINELLGIPSSCLFDLSGGMGLGAGLFTDSLTAVGKLKYGVSGDLLCALNIKGELTGAASLEIPALGGDSVRDSLAIKAIGELTAKFGYCPFCIPFKATASASYNRGKWSFER